MTAQTEINIPMQLPPIRPQTGTFLQSCANCANSVYDSGDPDVGMGPYWECGLEDAEDPVTELIEFVYDCMHPSIKADAEEILASLCGHYEATYDECSCCGAKLPGDPAKIGYWSNGMFDCPQPLCSETCAEIDQITDMKFEEEFLMDSERYYTPRPLALCPHGNDPAECDPCMQYGDFMADCAREQRHFGNHRGRD